MAKNIQENSEILAKDPELHWQDLIDFYFVSEELYKKSNDPIISSKYHALFKAKVADLSKDGIIAKSYYDISP